MLREWGFSMRKVILAAAAGVGLLSAAPAAAQVTLQVDSATQKLTGANGVNVGGTLYDVTFADNTCDALFGGCDANSDFIFQTEAQALAAAQALLDQVFTGIYDTTPNLTEGCAAFDACVTIVPYGVTVRNANGFDMLVAYSRNWAGTTADDAFSRVNNAPAPYDSNFNTRDNSYYGYAVFSTHVAAAAVPEPATWAMMLFGFGAIGFQMRRQRKPALA